jgi:cytosine/adenosine deaminase-related metal-dependent hydrolase
MRLVSADWVVPISTPPMRDASVLLDGEGQVVAVGRRKDLAGRGEEERVTGVLLPGLVNAHTHLELSHLAGRVPGGAGLVPWVSQVMKLGGGDEALAAARAAVALGTAAVGDVGNGTGAVAAIGAAGLRGVFFHELVGSREARTGDALADAAREKAEHLAAHGWPEGLGYAIAPHAPYSVGPELFRRIFALRGEHPTSVHVAEDAAELELLAEGAGPWVEILAGLGVAGGSRTPRLGPMAYLASLGAFEGRRPPLLVHMVHASAEDRGLAARHRAPVVLCPRSNLHIGGRLPDVPALLKDGVPLALGTDSLASTPDLSLWQEMRALAAAFPDLSPSLWLATATSAGAAALGLTKLGSLAPGKRPGVLVAELGPVGDPVAALVREAPPVRWVARA